MANAVLAEVTATEYASSSMPRAPARKGANGVRLKKFESVMCDMFSHPDGHDNHHNSAEISMNLQALEYLMPRYSKLPPSFATIDERRQLLSSMAMPFWKRLGIASEEVGYVKHEAHAGNCGGEWNGDGVRVAGSAASASSSVSSSPWPFDESSSLPAMGRVRVHPSVTSGTQNTSGSFDRSALDKSLPASKITATTPANFAGADRAAGTKSQRGNPHLSGNLTNNLRAWRKEMQLANLIRCILSLIPMEYKFGIETASVGVAPVLDCNARVVTSDATRQSSNCEQFFAKAPNHKTSLQTRHICDDIKDNNINATSEDNNQQQINEGTKFQIVDFAGGTGHLAVPLALLLPQCQVVCVDLKKNSLDLLHRRVDGPGGSHDGGYQVDYVGAETKDIDSAEECAGIVRDNEDHGRDIGATDSGTLHSPLTQTQQSYDNEEQLSEKKQFPKQRSNSRVSTKNQDKLPYKSQTLSRTKTLPNLYTYHGSIQSYPYQFQIGASLHACGEASDWTLRKCLQWRDKHPRQKNEGCEFANEDENKNNNSSNASEGKKNDQADSTSGCIGFVICGCCCGKLRRDAGNPYVYQSTGTNQKEIIYPQSTMMRSLGLCKEAHSNNHFVDNHLEKINEDNRSSMGNISMTDRMTPAMFDEIARASDYSELGDVRKPRNACRRAAKSLVEWDRLLFAKECIGLQPSSSLPSINQNSSCSKNKQGNVVLARMVPWEASPKNDILIGWFHDEYNPYRRKANAPIRQNADEKIIDGAGADFSDHMRGSIRSNLDPIPPMDTSCHGDFQIALEHLFGRNNIPHLETHDCNTSYEIQLQPSCKDQNDWTAQEEAKVRTQLQEFLACSNLRNGKNLPEEETTNGQNLDEQNSKSVDNHNDNRLILRFPTGMGSRKRKLVHYVAESMGLAHWCEGKKDSKKIVAVAQRRFKSGHGGGGQSKVGSEAFIS